MVSCMRQQCEPPSDTLLLSNRPGGELSPGEDEVEGLKRLMTEVATSQHTFKLLIAVMVVDLMYFNFCLDVRSSDGRTV